MTINLGTKNHQMNKRDAANFTGINTVGSMMVKFLPLIGLFPVLEKQM